MLLDLLRDTELQHAPVVSAQAGHHLRREDVRVIAADELAVRAAEHLAETAVDVGVAAGGILDEHRGRGVLQHLAQPGFTGLQGAIGAPQGRDVSQVQEHAPGALRVWLEADQHVHGGLVPAPELPEKTLGQIGPRSGPTALEPGLRGGAVRLLEWKQGRERHAHQFALPVSEQFGGLGVASLHLLREDQLRLGLTPDQRRWTFIEAGHLSHHRSRPFGMGTVPSLARGGCTSRDFYPPETIETGGKQKAGGGKV